MMGPVDTELQLGQEGPDRHHDVSASRARARRRRVGKLARWLEKTHKKKPLLVAADIYRPAAVEQLKTLGRQLDMPVFSIEGKDPVTICREARATPRCARAATSSSTTPPAASRSTSR